MARNIYCRTLDATGQLTINDEPLGKGGEGSVHSVQRVSIQGISETAENLVVKLYHEPSEGNRARKIAAMIQNPVDTSFVAWPLAIVFDENKQFAGYLMQKLQKETYRPWEELANARDRRDTSSDFDFRYALAACRNLAVALDSIHTEGHRLGDLNESGVFISRDSKVLLVDSDSAQIVSAQGEVFPCIVGKAEYTAPEISSGSFKDNPRTIQTDVFAYAIASFQMLTGGFHPTDGIYTGSGESTLAAERIKNNIYPSFKDYSKLGYKKLERIPFQCLPANIQRLLIKSLSYEQNERPSTKEIIEELDQALSNLKVCSKFKQHWYDSNSMQCPWCAHHEATSFDPWVKHAVKKSSSNFQQVGLPTVNFNDSNESSAPRRAPVKTSPAVGHQNQQSNNNQSNYSTQNTSPQGGYSNASGSQTPQQSQNYQQQNSPHNHSKPRGPEFHKGKIILEYADGSRRVRPAYSVLFKNNPKMALYCLREETPTLFQAWWSTTRPVAKLSGLLVGLFIALGISISWIFVVPLLESLMPELSFTSKVLEIAGLISAVTASLGSLSLFFSAIKDMVKSRKRFGSLDNVKRESWWKTSLRFIPIAIAFGPVIVVILVYLLLLGVVKMITSPENN